MRTERLREAEKQKEERNSKPRGATEGQKERDRK